MSDNIDYQSGCTDTAAQILYVLWTTSDEYEEIDDHESAHILRLLVTQLLPSHGLTWQDLYNFHNLFAQAFPNEERE